MANEFLSRLAGIQYNDMLNRAVNTAQIETENEKLRSTQKILGDFAQQQSVLSNELRPLEEKIEQLSKTPIVAETEADILKMSKAHQELSSTIAEATSKRNQLYQKAVSTLGVIGSPYADRFAKSILEQGDMSNAELQSYAKRFEHEVAFQKALTSSALTRERWNQVNESKKDADAFELAYHTLRYDPEVQSMLSVLINEADAADLNWYAEKSETVKQRIFELLKDKGVNIEHIDTAWKKLNFVKGKFKTANTVNGQQTNQQQEVPPVSEKEYETAAGTLTVATAFMNGLSKQMGMKPNDILNAWINPNTEQKELFANNDIAKQMKAIFGERMSNKGIESSLYMSALHKVELGNPDNLQFAPMVNELNALSLSGEDDKYVVPLKEDIINSVKGVNVPKSNEARNWLILNRDRDNNFVTLFNPQDLIDAEQQVLESSEKVSFAKSSKTLNLYSSEMGVPMEMSASIKSDEVESNSAEAFYNQAVALSRDMKENDGIIDEGERSQIGMAVKRYYEKIGADLDYEVVPDKSDFHTVSGAIPNAQNFTDSEKTFFRRTSKFNGVTHAMNKQFGIPESLIMGTMVTESSGSTDDKKGLMQITKDAIKDIVANPKRYGFKDGITEDMIRTNDAYNIMAGTAYLSGQLKRFFKTENGKFTENLEPKNIYRHHSQRDVLRTALRSYNAGYGGIMQELGGFSFDKAFEKILASEDKEQARQDFLKSHYKIGSKMTLWDEEKRRLKLKEKPRYTMSKLVEVYEYPDKVLHHKDSYDNLANEIKGAYNNGKVQTGQ